MKANISVTVDTDLLEAAKKAGINRSQALSFGIMFKLAERDLCEYPANLLSSKIEKMASHLNAQNE